MCRYHEHWICSVVSVWTLTIIPYVLYIIFLHHLISLLRWNYAYSESWGLKFHKHWNWIFWEWRRAPKFKFLEYHSSSVNLFNWFRIIGLLNLFNIINSSYCKDKIIAEWHYHEIVSDWKSTAAFIVCEHRHDGHSNLRCKVMERVVINVTKDEVFRRRLNRIVRVLL